MSWIEVDGSATIVTPSSMYDVALITWSAAGEGAAERYGEDG